MSDSIGYDDASTSALDRESCRQERIAAAHDRAKEEAWDRVGSLALMLAEYIPEVEVRSTSARAAIAFMNLPDQRWTFGDGDLLRMTGPDYGPELRLAAMDEIWRRHMEAMKPWIAQEAERIAE